MLKKYLPEDEKSVGYATLLEWNNILFEPEESVLDTPKNIVRVGSVQWQMRTVESYEDMLGQIEFFVDTVSDYQSDFIVFPEFFNAPLMGLSEKVDIREMSTHDEVIDQFKSIAEAFSFSSGTISRAFSWVDNSLILGAIPSLWASSQRAAHKHH